MTIRPHHLVAAGIALSLCSLSAANAQGAPLTRTDTGMSPDANSSVLPSAGLTENFDKLDRDRDGTISPNEAARDESVAAAFKKLDMSKDGMLDISEFAALTQDRSPFPTAVQRGG